MIKKWFKNLKIRNKFLLASVVFVLIAVFIVVRAIISIHDVTTHYTRITEGPNKRLLDASDASVELMNIRRNNVIMSTLQHNLESAKRYYAMSSNSYNTLLQILNEWQKNLENDPFLSDNEKNEQVESFNETRQKLTEYMVYTKEAYDAVMTGQDEVATAATVAEAYVKCVPIGDLLVNRIETNRKLTQMFIDYQARIADEKAHDAINIIAVLAILLFALLLVRDLLISRAITSPINAMNKSIREIEKGNLDHEIRLSHKDELGMLSNHIGDMVDKISDLNTATAILDNLSVFIFVTDLEYNIIFVNNLFTKYRGVGRGEVIGQKCYKIVSDEEEPCQFCPLPDLFPQKDTFPTMDWERPLEVLGRENIMGQVEEHPVQAWFGCRSAIVRWTDGAYALFNAYTDETVRKQHSDQLFDAARLAEDASRIKSSFLANMSHEIRTPMNSIIGFSELALDSADLTPQTRVFLENIKNSSEGLLGIINDILDISKIEAGKIVLESIPFDLHDIFKVCQNIIQPKAQAKKIDPFRHSEPAPGKRLIGDPTRLRQCILNLLTNSVKFTNCGIVKLLSSVVSVDNEANTMLIHFEVKDSGIGMTEEQVAKVFDPFTQADNSTTRKYGGTGLGLTITRNFIELMGSTLHVESAVGIGSRFSFDITFPTCDIDESAQKQEETDFGSEKPYFYGAEILVCEDHEMNQMVITEHLSRLGIKTNIAGNGKIGVEMVAERMDGKGKLFDLIFMDIHMPVMDGLEAVKKLKEMGSTIPIVALTANIMTTDQELYKEYGMNDYLPKPFATRDLWNCLLKYVKSAQPPEGADASALHMQLLNEEDEDAKLRLRLITNFLKDNQNKAEEIKTACLNGDIKLAHRLAHTLKGLAGMVGQPVLQSVANAMEYALNENDIDGAMNITDSLETELKKSLAELAAVKQAFEPTETAAKDSEPVAALDNLEALHLINKVRPMLESGDSDCIELIQGLKAISASQKLIEQVEDYDFELALETLEEIKRELGG
jgi:signal transduction histidine kinase/CheY-like chemotaxis protein/HAMP domain-containing protein